ncbi:MAG TPA: sigma-70 family RNA polymerase sigma factor [Steroidobacteraceae bacterium]|nr:sigma-70 family RNA polymerase sigma factor [Steroidobacteraceae bacterium]
MYSADRQLVAAMLAGDARAFDAFFEAYAKRLAAFATRRTTLPAAAIEEIVQNTLIKAIRRLASYRGEAALFTWLCEICRNELVNLHRREARRSAEDSLEQSSVRETVLELRAPESESPLGALEIAAQRSAVAEALNSLPERYARALEWKYGDGFSVEEIARMLGLTTIAAQSLLARARAAFRQVWPEEQPP